MTENTLDTLRAHAARLVDEAQRLQRMLVFRSDEAIAREHLGNVEAVAALCRRDGLGDVPTVEVVPIAVATEQVIPEPVPIQSSVIEVAPAPSRKRR